MFTTIGINRIFSTSHYVTKKMNDYGMRSLSEDSGYNLDHIHVESLCETVSDFLDTLDGNDVSNEELIEKRLSESEIAILECGLLIADIKSVSDNIDQTYIPSFEESRNELVKMFGNLERICDQVMPQLGEDLDKIQELVNALDIRFKDFNRERSVGWIMKYLPTGAMKTRDDHVRYAHQVAASKLHTAETLLQHFEEPTQEDSNSSISVNSAGMVDLSMGSNQDSNTKADYEAL